MNTRKRTREIAMELLYQNTMNERDVKETIADYFETSEETTMDQVDLVYLETVLAGVEEKKEELDALIEKYLVGWKIQRLSRINLSILRLATYELLYMEDIPPKVSITEAVDLGKKYSEESAAPFINGVLDKISKHNEEPAPEAEESSSVSDTLSE